MLENVTNLGDLMGEIGVVNFLMVFAVILLVIKEAWSLIAWFLEKFGIETKYTLEKKKDRNLLNDIKDRLEILEIQRQDDVKNSIQHDKEIEIALKETNENLKQTNESLVLERIESKRWKILDFASGIKNGADYSKEQFEHIKYDVFPTYEDIIEKNHMTNGKVNDSMKTIDREFERKFLSTN